VAHYGYNGDVDDMFKASEQCYLKNTKSELMDSQKLVLGSIPWAVLPFSMEIFNGLTGGIVVQHIVKHHCMELSDNQFILSVIDQNSY
jgi:hypothetical protein